MARRKISASSGSKRKDDLDPSNDQFIDTTTTALDWAYERRRPIIAVLAAALLASIAGIVVNKFVEKSKVDASEALSLGLEAAVAPIIPPSDDEAQIPPKADDETLTFETAKARATDTLKKFQETINKGDSSTKSFAELGLASANYDLGEYEKAIKEYEKLLSSDKGKLPWFRQAALEGLGLSLEAGGRTDDALKRFEELMEGSEGTIANTARYHAARMAQKKGDSKKAQELFKQVVDSYAENGEFGRLDYVFVQARERLLVLNPEADVPALPTSGFEGIDPRLLQQLMQAQAGGGPS